MIRARHASVDPPDAPRRYLVTGAAGFIGSHLCERLLGAGHAVLAVDNFDPYYPRHVKDGNAAPLRVHPRCDFVEAGLMDLDLPAVLAGVDGVFHLAGQPGVRGSWGNGFAGHVEANLRVTQHLLEALAAHPVPAVCASSSSVYGGSGHAQLRETDVLAPRSPYGLSKLAGEQLIEVYRREYGLTVTSLRYFTVFGPRQRPDMAFQRFITAALTGGRLTLFGDGTQSRDFTYVDDVVAATIAALGAPSPVYNIGGGTPATMNEVLAALTVLHGGPLHVERTDFARGDVTHTWADTTLARSELGWVPRTDLWTGLADQWTAVAGQRAA